MKRIVLKVVSMMLAVVSVFCISELVFAADIEDEQAKGEIIITTTKEERDQQFEDVIAGLNFFPDEKTREPKYHYKTEYYDYIKQLGDMLEIRLLEDIDFELVVVSIFLILKDLLFL